MECKIIIIIIKINSKKKRKREKEKTTEKHIYNIFNDRTLNISEG